MYVHNAYYNAEGTRKIRRVNIYNPDGVLAYSDSHAFTPNHHSWRWNVWHSLNPAKIFNKPGVWRVETTVDKRSQLKSSRKIEVHDGN